ncbi:MAG: hypothetical protein WBR28_04755 [Mycobacterium sp.]
MRSVLVGLMVLSGGVFVPAQVPAVPTVPAPTWLSTSGVAAVAPRRSHARRVMPSSVSTSSSSSSLDGRGGTRSGASRW